jgi:hypothetical protein
MSATRSQMGYRRHARIVEGDTFGAFDCAPRKAYRVHPELPDVGDAQIVPVG